MKGITQEEAKTFLRKVMGDPRKTLEGKEKEQILLLLAMMEPFNELNNQRSLTQCYMIGNKEYHVTYFPDNELPNPVVDEILNEDKT